jgi:hypothetical protein
MSFTVRRWLPTWVALAVFVVAMFLTGHATVDFYQSLGTFGVSAGSNTHYCSAEWAVRGLATELPEVSCESGS